MGQVANLLVRCQSADRRFSQSGFCYESRGFYQVSPIAFSKAKASVDLDRWAIGTKIRFPGDWLPEALYVWTNVFKGLKFVFRF